MKMIVFMVIWAVHFMASEPGDQEIQDKELTDNGVESAEISEYEV